MRGMRGSMDSGTYSIIPKKQFQLLSDVELPKDEWQSKLVDKMKVDGLDLRYGFLEPRKEYDIVNGGNVWIYSMVAGEST